ncbi:MAG: hypothetical protein Q8K98_02650 [Bacteroidota bacterium]|nr:hypothetical protein [Bacteroidota bacterium]
MLQNYLLKLILVAGSLFSLFVIFVKPDLYSGGIFLFLGLLLFALIFIFSPWAIAGVAAFKLPYTKSLNIGSALTRLRERKNI